MIVLRGALVYQLTHSNAWVGVVTMAANTPGFVVTPVAGCLADRCERDAALALQVHRVEHLFGHFPLGQTAAALDKPIGQRRFTVVDVGDDRKIADVLHSNAVR